MSGSTPLAKQKQILKAFNLLAPYPLDSRKRISSISLIDTELPMGQRYAGLMFYDESTKRTYEIIDTDDDIFDEFELVMRRKVFTIPASIDLSVDIKYTFVHNLDTRDMQITCISNNVEIRQTIENIVLVDVVNLNEILINFTKYYEDTAISSIPADLRIVVIY